MFSHQNDNKEEKLTALLSKGIVFFNEGTTGTVIISAKILTRRGESSFHVVQGDFQATWPRRFYSKMVFLLNRLKIRAVPQN